MIASAKTREKMLDKRELLLEQIIKEYLKNPEPIGSEYLKVRLDIKISSATIRNYFKQLCEEGKLEQLHISSGRVPTNSALKYFWKKELALLEDSAIKSDSTERIKSSAKETKIFCIVRFYEPNFLREVINSGGRFLIAVFDNGEAVMEYNHSLERFLIELVGLEINDLVKISEEVCAFSLAKKLRSLLGESISIKEGNNELISMINMGRFDAEAFEEYLNGDIMDRLINGLHFQNIVPEGFMAIKQDIKVAQKNAKMLVVGRLFRDYSRFYSLIKE